MSDIHPLTPVQVTWSDLRAIAQTAAGDVSKRFDVPSHHAFTVPNNLIGRVVLWIMKRYLNRQVYRLTPRGRTPKVKGMRRSQVFGLRLKDAKVLAVYIQLKRPYDATL